MSGLDELDCTMEQRPLLQWLGHDSVPWLVFELQGKDFVRTARAQHGPLPLPLSAHAAGRRLTTSNVYLYKILYSIRVIVLAAIVVL